MNNIINITGHFFRLLRVLQAVLCLWLSLLVIQGVQAESGYHFDVQGVKSDSIRNNIELHLVAINDELDVQDPLWQGVLAKTVATAVEPYGYYNSHSVSRLQADNTIQIDVTLDTPLFVAHVTREIVGQGRADPSFRATYDAFPMKKGEVMNQITYEKFKSDMFAYALSHGYFDFYWQAARLDLVRELREANILLIAQSGAQYKFGEIRIVGENKAADIIKRLSPFDFGQAYSAELLSRYNRALNQSGYFSHVIARPLVSEARDFAVPIEIRVTHLARDTFNVGGGFSTDIGPRFRLKWNRPWVNSKGHSLSSQWYYSKPEQSFSADYRIPKRDLTHDYASITGGYQYINNNDTDSESTEFAFQRYWRKDQSKWQNSATVSFSRTFFTQGSRDPETTDLILPGYSLSYSSIDNELDVDEGQRYLFSLEGAGDFLGSDITLIKATAKGKWINTLAKHRFTFRAEAGWIETNNFNKVPPNMRFFAGGDQSIRGFGYNTVGTRERIEVDGQIEEPLIGDPYLLTGSIEYAYPIADDWRLAWFVDAGLATQDFDNPPAIGTGPGVHWLTPIGPVRLYVARGYSDYENTWRVHFSLGPEL